MGRLVLSAIVADTEKVFGTGRFLEEKVPVVYSYGPLPVISIYNPICNMYN